MNRAPPTAVLIVEDELLVAHDLQQSLSDMGYDAFAVAASDAEALAHAARRAPDVVLMDIRIKGEEDGIQTAERLKQQHPVSVIFLTAFADDSMVDRAKKTECDGYLLKPVKQAELRSMIEISLYRRQLQVEREKRVAGERRLFAITENVPVAIAYFDRHGRVQFANQVFREVVPPQDKLHDVPAMTFLGEDIYRRSYASRQSALLGERAQFLLEIAREDGTERKLEVTFFPDNDPAGDVVGVYGIGYDVTEREQMAADLRQARADLETILNAVPARIASWYRDLSVRFANTAARSGFLVEQGSTIGANLCVLVGERQFAQIKPLIDSALDGNTVSAEQSETDDQGATHFRHAFYIPERRTGEVVGLYTLAFDVTELRESHERIRQLAQRLESVREEERRKVAITLHDGIAQDLFAMKLGIDNLISQNRRKSVRKLCVEVLDLLTQCMEDVRLIANELRPVALKYFDVSSVLVGHARNFGSRANLAIEVIQEGELPPLEERIGLLLFRAAQEALTNVARHAHASQARVILGSYASGVTLEVLDNGVGITDASFKKPLSLGLLGIRERAVAHGGSLSIERRAPHGTRFLLRIPTAPSAM